MDAPLFGEEKPRDKFVQYGVGFLLLVGAILAFVFAFVNASKSTGITNIILAVAVAINFGLIVTLWRWYRVGDLDPKFRYFLAVLMLNMLILVIVSCLFSFAFDVQQVCPDGYFIMPGTTTASCYPKCTPGRDACLYVSYESFRVGYGQCFENSTGALPPSSGSGEL